MPEGEERDQMVAADASGKCDLTDTIVKTTKLRNVFFAYGVDMLSPAKARCAVNTAGMARN